jgi:hypothetical protein
MSLAGTPSSQPPSAPPSVQVVSAPGVLAQRTEALALGKPVAMESAEHPVDALMERASQALVATDYFAAQELCLRAIERRRRARDFHRLARALLPLQEARRQLRQMAVDAASAGQVFVLRSLPSRGVTIEPGAYLLEPPLIAMDARTFRDLARARKVPALVLAKEPTMSNGQWPIAAVGVALGGQPLPVVTRVRVEPPAQFMTGSLRGVRTLSDIPRSELPGPEWFLRTQEALGDAGIAKIRADWPADHRVDDLLEYLEAVPDHEKLHQAVAAAAREAAIEPPSPRPRRRGMIDDPFSF